MNYEIKLTKELTAATFRIEELEAHLSSALSEKERLEKEKIDQAEAYELLIEKTAEVGTRDIQELRSLSSAYRDALEGLLKLTEPTSSYEQFCEGVRKMQAALDRGPEVPPLIVSTLTDEQRKEIGETCRREVRESWEKIRGNLKPEEPVEREEVEILIENTWANIAENTIKTGRMYAAAEVVEAVTAAILAAYRVERR